MAKEIWKPVRNYEGHYEVSSYGRVRNAKSKRVLKLRKINRGYYGLRISKDGKAKFYLLHRLVAEAFCEKPAGKNVVDHIDGNKENNRADNLRWLTQKENVHSGRRVIKPVIRSDGRYYESICATQADGFSKGSVCECCKGNRKQTGGYGWRYADEIVQATSA